MYIQADPAVRDVTHVARDSGTKTSSPAPSEWWSTQLSSSSSTSLPTNTVTSAIPPDVISSISTLLPSSTANSTGLDTIVATIPSAKYGLSPTIIGGIVAGAVVVVAVMIGLFVRRWYVMKRQARTAMNRSGMRYNSGLDLATEKVNDADKLVSDKSEYTSAIPEPKVSHWHYHDSNARTGGTATSKITVPSETSAPAHGDLRSQTPAVRHNDPNESNTRIVLPMPSAVVVPLSDNVTHSTPNIPLPNTFYTLAVMRTPFVQSLPDELPASVGEMVGIVQEYDDGWSFCITFNRDGIPTQQGMIPSQCLEKLSANTGTRKPSVSSTSLRSKRQWKRIKDFGILQWRGMGGHSTENVHGRIIS